MIIFDGSFQLLRFTLAKLTLIYLKMKVYIPHQFVFPKFFPLPAKIYIGKRKFLVGQGDGADRRALDEETRKYLSQHADDMRLTEVTFLSLLYI